jgi:pimeloyl-ACP methyl ester carboxylesterase
VLIVHGNHNMMHASDPGYAWLGEHLASRGFILASVDQNFLNGAPIIGNISPENDARGWLLLEHLKLWQAWSADDASPFFDKVDLNNIALIGHSRGGEAAVIAATFNDLPHYPDDASITFDYAFAIRGVVAIAPSDGQYRPADRFTPLTDVSYLVLQGGHDSDSHLFLGDRQYQRTTFSGDGDPFKASVYIYAANHGQFNTVWGRSDLPAPWSWLLNTQPLMSGTAQRQAGKVFITAFLEETLARRSSYRPLFHDHRSAAQWLPDTAYVTRFQDAGFHVVSNFEEDIDLTTTTAPGGRQAGENLALWREGDIRLRGGSLRNNHAVTLGWQAADGIEDTPAYTIELPEGLAAEWQLDDQSLLSFDLSASTESLPGSERENEAQPLDLTVELVDDAGRVVALPLSAFRPIAPPLPVRFTKLSMLDAAHFKQATEPLLQTYALPLASFVEQEPAFDLTRLAALRFRFDQTPTGIILLDEVGFAQAAQP